MPEEATQNSENVTQPENTTEPKQPETSTEPQITKHKLKVNGVEREVDQNELLRLASLGLGANEKFEQAAKLRREHEEMMKQIEADPIKYLQSKDPEFRKKAEDFLYQQILDDEMSPEAKKARELEEQLKKYQEKEEQDKKSREEEENQKQIEKYSAEYEKQLISALESSQLPKDPDIVRDVVRVMQDALEADVELSFEEAASFVKQKTISSVMAVLSKVDNLHEFLGDEILNKIRKSDLEKIKGAGKSAPTDTHTEPKQENRQTFKGHLDFKEAIMRDMGLKG